MARPSVAVALVIEVIELLSLLADKLRADPGPRGRVVLLDLDDAGFVAVGLFILTWVVTLAVCRLGRVEERWTAGLADAPEQ